MSVLVVVTDPDRLGEFLTSAFSVVNVAQQQVTVLCWIHSPTVRHSSLLEPEDSVDADKLVLSTRQTLAEISATFDIEFDPHDIRILCTAGPDVVQATLAEIRAGQHDSVVVDASHELPSATQVAIRRSLLRRSPCETILFCRTHASPAKTKRIIVVAADSPHDLAAFETFTFEAQNHQQKFTFARLEDETGAEASELGQRELKRLMRAAGITTNKHIKRRVFARDSLQELIDTAESHQLVLIGAHQSRLLHLLQKRTTQPGIAVIRRAPLLKRLAQTENSRWKTKLSPADYADMTQALRHGASLNMDFLVMLGLAAAIASLGLLQDSPAVVIGSMLLAPLMTPMIACGLAIAQGSKKLGQRSMLSIGTGFLLTLAVSLLIGGIAPGEEITSQVVARGKPNMLDLLIALFSAVAAAYALARPGIVGAIAGVAIATALVPPLCSMGISLAYQQFLNAQGAALLFATNLVAIILGAAVTFRCLGVTIASAGIEERRWVFRITGIICLALILLYYPLHRRLNERIEQGQTQPRTYPLTKTTQDSLVEFVERTPEVELVSSGRPSTPDGNVDVVLVLSTPHPLPPSYANELVEICRVEMDAPDLVVEVHCFLNAWQETSQNAPSVVPED